MSARVLRVLAATDHPEKPGISVVGLGDVQFVAQKVDAAEGPVPRYPVGNLVTFVSDGSIVPEGMLRGHYWNDAEGKGALRGSRGDRVKAGNFAKVRSDGIHFEVEQDGAGGGIVRNLAGETLAVSEGDDVSAFLGITEWQG